MSRSRRPHPVCPAGDHPFAIYQWQLVGLKEDAMLVPVVADPEVARAFMDVLASRATMPSRRLRRTSSMLEALDSWHHELWVADAPRISPRPPRSRGFAATASSASHRARMAILEEQLAAAPRERGSAGCAPGQIARAIADHREALDRLARDEARADILPRRVAAGVIRVEG